MFSESLDNFTKVLGCLLALFTKGRAKSYSPFLLILIIPLIKQRPFHLSHRICITNNTTLLTHLS